MIIDGDIFMGEAFKWKSEKWKDWIMSCEMLRINSLNAAECEHMVGHQPYRSTVAIQLSVSVKCSQLVLCTAHSDPGGLESSTACEALCNIIRGLGFYLSNLRTHLLGIVLYINLTGLQDVEIFD